MDKKRTYFPPTTAQQRRLLFEVWEKTGDRKEACRQAHVCEGTFYKWKPRFEAGSYEALAAPDSRAPKEHHQTPPEIVEQVVKLRCDHPDWGKRRIADELAKGNNWAPLVSVNTVKRILQDAGLWPAAKDGVKKGAPVARPAARKRPDKP